MAAVTMTHLIVSACKVEVLLVRDMFDKNGKKDSKPKGVARPCGALKLKPFICQRVKEQCSLSSLSTSQRAPLLEGGGREGKSPPPPPPPPPPPCSLC